MAISGLSPSALLSNARLDRLTFNQRRPTCRLGFELTCFCRLLWRWRRQIRLNWNCGSIQVNECEKVAFLLWFQLVQRFEDDTHTHALSLAGKKVQPHTFFALIGSSDVCQQIKIKRCVSFGRERVCLLCLHNFQAYTSLACQSLSFFFLNKKVKKTSANLLIRRPICRCWKLSPLLLSPLLLLITPLIGHIFLFFHFAAVNHLFKGAFSLCLSNQLGRRLIFVLLLLAPLSKVHLVNSEIFRLFFMSRSDLVFGSFLKLHCLLDYRRIINLQSLINCCCCQLACLHVNDASLLFFFPLLFHHLLQTI